MAVLARGIMYQLRPWIRLLMLFIILLTTSQSVLAATEYLAAYKLYLSEKSGYFESAQDAANASAKSICSTCKMQYVEDYWDTYAGNWQLAMARQLYLHSHR